MGVASPKMAPQGATRESVLTKAVGRAARRLAVTNAELAQVLGVSEATVSRLQRDGLLIKEGSKAFELGQLFLRFFRGLDAITGGDDASSASWLRSRNLALEGSPAEMIRSVQGLVEVVNYVDSQRART